MNETSPLLELLRDVHMPPPPPLWPPAPGWWLIALLAALAIAAALWRSWPWLSSQPLRWMALRALRAPEAASLSLSEQLLLINRTLRRLIRAEAPGHPALSYSGRSWLEFLDRSSGMKGFSQGFGRCLGRELYRARPEADLQRVQALARRWVRRHNARALKEWKLNPASP